MHFKMKKKKSKLNVVRIMSKGNQKLKKKKKVSLNNAQKTN